MSPARDVGANYARDRELFADEEPASGHEVSGYREAVDCYRSRGWPSAFPLEAGTKWPPPAGFTGYEGAWPTDATYERWKREHPRGNLALRLPKGVIGIDVDLWKLDHAVAWDEFTALLPALPLTVMSTSRTDGSGIRFYRVDDDDKFRGAFMWGEVVQYHHRYGASAPSIHPDTGRAYRWLTTDGELCEEPDGSFYVPRLDQLPELPAEWVAALKAPE